MNFSNNHKKQSDVKLPVCEDCSLMVYWYDAYEETNGNPYIILFGKIYNSEDKSFNSISIVVRNLERKIYLLPKLNKLKDIDLEDKKILEENKDLTINMFQEFEELRKNKFSFIKKIQTKPVIKKYCFELPIPQSKIKIYIESIPFLKIKYNAEYGALPSSINSGEYFDHIFHKNRSFLEMFLLSRKIKGPCWLRIKSYELPNGFNITWSQLEVNCMKYKDIVVAEENMPAPPFKILSFSTKVILNNNEKEIIAIAGICKDNYSVDEDSTNKKDTNYQNFVIMRKVDFKNVSHDFYGNFLI